MSTDADYGPTTVFQHATYCQYCRAVLRAGARFCSACGKERVDLVPQAIARRPVIKEGERVESSWPLPPASLQSRRPSDQTAALLQRSWREEQDRHGLFRDSGPLPEEILRRGHQGQALAAKLSAPMPVAPPGEDLPDWLKPATGKHRTPAPIEHAWLNGGMSEPLSGVQPSGNLYDSGPTTIIQRVTSTGALPAGRTAQPVEILLPDGTIACKECHGVGKLYGRVWPPEECPTCLGRGRIQPAIAQPMPDNADAITGPGLTTGEQIMRAIFQKMQEAPAPVETALVDRPAETPPPGTSEVKATQRANLLDTVANTLEWLGKVGMQAEFQADILRRHTDHVRSEDVFLFKVAANAVRQVVDLVELAIQHLSGWQEAEEARDEPR